MIDYSIVIVMLPLVLVGSFVGVLLNIILPPLILSAILTAILILLTLQSYFKGRQIYNKETANLIVKQVELEKRQKQTVMANKPDGTGVR